MMNHSVAAQYQGMVEQEWKNADTVKAWAKWHDKFAIQSMAITDGLVRHARIGTGMTILDLSCGSGEPATTIAELVGAEGHVVATDLSEGMLDVARTNARKVGVSNITFRQADAQ